MLSGTGNDGTAGLETIQRAGGTTVIQQPTDALYPEMPQSALNNSHVDHCVPISDMGTLLAQQIQGLWA